MELETLFGNRTTERILLHLFHYGEIHARGIARDYDSVVSPFIRQLGRLEDVGILVSREVGRTRLYQFNPKSAYVTPLKKLVEIAYENIPLSDREKIFHTRRRPRRKGKPVL
ncbi:MAG: winged helix-turn-helix domain-containing protein [Bdellovibrionota bacterium]